MIVTHSPFRLLSLALHRGRRSVSAKVATSAALALAALLSVGSPSGVAQVAPAAEPGTVLIRNVRVFDGRRAALSGISNVLVRGNLIERISTGALAGTTGTQVIDGGGRTLMPGLIDAHWHAMFVRPTPVQLLTNDVGYTTIQAGVEATATLMRGFTTVRDMGGPAFSLKRSIDEGLVDGPRIYPSGAMITITSGHGDFRQLSELPRRPGQLSHIEELGGAAIADSPDEVRMRAREQLMHGASQVKLTAGGGVASPFSPLDVSTFTEGELQAAVDAAGNWGTYVAVHAYTPAAIQRAVKVGVKCIEHAHLMDEASAKMMADNGVWLSTQPFVDMAIGATMGPNEQAKLKEVVDGTDRMYRLARKYRIKTAFGTDILFSSLLATRQGNSIVDMTKWYTAGEALVMATSTNGELLRLSGPRNPYPGLLGVVEQGAYADLLVVDGNPLDNIRLVADPERNFVMIMKDGKIYKNRLN
ncbi:amidohydrolase family protein [Novosphingobium sp. ZW T3_23]|uniref:metal-dependent hydrolase family protein n=1 Tax=Novosphingobium sp. ZW T3_23 TaxID=3378084 RepID=UPI0038521201